MKNRIGIIFISMVVVFGIFTSCSNHQDTVDAKREKRVNKILATLTLEEKILLISGSKSHMGTNGIPAKGIPALTFADGPMGVHSRELKAPAYPALIGLAATFNNDLALQTGKAMGRDYRIRGVHVALGPGVNHYRMPTCGRNFEYMGEDPYVANKLVVEFIKGMQSEGTAATLKHFVGNFQEYDRHGVSTDVDERTLREIYLSRFEGAVIEADVAAVMTAYNPINGEHASENKYLLNDVLKGEWGFDGVVMSDWTSTYTTVQATNHGLDLEMPTGKFLNYEKLSVALKNGTVTIEVIDDKVRRLLRMMLRFGWIDNPELPINEPFNDTESEATALEIAREGIVLLKNDNILPVDNSKVNKIAIIGYQAGHEVYSGGGSAMGSPAHVVTLEQALREKCGDDIEISYHEGVNPWRFKQKFKTSEFFTPTGKPGLQVELFNNNSCSGKPALVRTDIRCNNFWKDGASPDPMITEELFSVRWTGKVMPKESSEHVFYSKCSDGGYRLFLNGKLVVDTWNSEVAKPISTFMNLQKGVPVDVVVEYRKARHWAGMMLGWEAVSAFEVDYNKTLAAAEDADLVVFSGGFVSSVESEAFDRDFAMHKSIEKLLVNVAERNPNTVVVLYAGGGVDMSKWLDKVKGVMHIWYPGMNGTIAAAEILMGEISPSGKLPITIEKELSDNPAYDCYFDPLTKRHVQMCEGVFGGYKHFDRAEATPLYYFGDGLSYTSFEYSNIQLSGLSFSKNGQIMVTCDVQNTGKMKASETVLLFISDKEASVARPIKELKGFAKVNLEPGELKTVSFTITPEELKFYDTYNKAWKYEQGEFNVIITSSADNNAPNRLVASFEYK